MKTMLIAATLAIALTGFVVAESDGVRTVAEADGVKVASAPEGLRLTEREGLRYAEADGIRAQIT